MINSRKLQDLTPDTQAKAEAFIAACQAADIDVIITSTYRDDEAQQAIYEKGRGLPGRIVTNASGGHSYHNYRVAFDFVPARDGQPVWDSDALWAQCGVIGESVGLEWGGSWSKFPDKPHMQNTGGYTIAQLAGGATAA